MNPFTGDGNPDKRDTPHTRVCKNSLTTHLVKYLMMDQEEMLQDLTLGENKVGDCKARIVQALHLFDLSRFPLSKA